MNLYVEGCELVSMLKLRNGQYLVEFVDGTFTLATSSEIQVVA